jgi:hypothetical protein
MPPEIDSGVYASPGAEGSGPSSIVGQVLSSANLYMYITQALTDEMVTSLENIEALRLELTAPDGQLHVEQQNALGRITETKEQALQRLNRARDTYLSELQAKLNEALCPGAGEVA